MSCKYVDDYLMTTLRAFEIIRIFIVCSALIVCSCSREPEPAPRPRDSLSDRLEIINQAREVQKKENQAVESRNKLVNDIFNNNRGKGEKR